MAKLPSYAKEFKNHKVIVFQDGSMTHHQVLGIDSGLIETEFDMLPVKDAVRYYDQTNAGFTYIFNLDLPSKVEAGTLKELRRSTAIKNIMSFDREKGFDVFKFMPYVIAVVALLF